MKNWKTTLLGALIAVGVALQPIIESGSISWKALLKAAAIALFGYLCKDFDKTGLPNNETTKS